MTEQERLLRLAVSAAPADDLPRRVIADWYDENGQPDRAEFIRTQLRIAEIEAAVEGNQWHSAGLCSLYCTLCPELAALEATADQILCLNGDQSWFRLYEWMPATRLRSTSYHRGFGWSVMAKIADIRRHLPELVRLEPVVRAIASDRFSHRWTPDAGSSSFDPPDVYSWLKSSAWPVNHSETALLPPDVLDRLAGAYPRRVGPSGRTVRFSSQEHAELALSAALVNEARAAADLPPIPYPEFP